VSIGRSTFKDTALYKNKDNWENGVLYIGKCLITADPDVVPSEYTMRQGTRVIAAGAFWHCENLTSITIPESVRSIGLSAFTDTALYKNKDSWNNGVLYIDNCLIEAKPDVVPSEYTIRQGTRVIAAGAFWHCENLTSITIPESVTEIGYFAFLHCSGLTSVTIPEGVTEIGNFAFSGCSGLTSVTIPEGVTEIGNFAFSGCSGLTSVTIPESVTKIGHDAFRGCENLTSITLPKSLLTQIGDEFFDDCNSLTITKTKKSSEPQPNDDLPF
jgi:G:T-mismatch repair DNA endonuclease (very short patch repair protein)